MFQPQRIFTLLSIWLGAYPNIATADLPKTQPRMQQVEQDATKTSAQEFERLFEQIESDSYADRKEAAGKFVAMGEQGIPTLKKKAQSEKHKTSIRAFNVLQQLCHSENPSGKIAAQTALKELADSGAAQLALRATEALNPSKEADAKPGQALPVKKPNPVKGRVVKVNGVQQLIPNAPIQMAINPPADPDLIIYKGRAKEGDKRFRLLKDRDGITVTVIEKSEGESSEKNAKRVTTYKAKNYYELKVHHPEAAQLYRRYKSLMKPQFSIKAKDGATLKIKGF